MHEPRFQPRGDASLRVRRRWGGTAAIVLAALRLRLTELPGRADRFRALGGVALAAALIEGAVGLAAGVPAHLATAAFVLGFTLVSFVAASWQERGHPTAAAIATGSWVLVLSVAVSMLFAGSPSAVMLPLVAFALVLPSLEPRTLLAFGALATSVAGADTVIAASAAGPGGPQFGPMSAAVAGVVVLGALLMIVLGQQRADLAALVARFTAIVEQAPMGIFRVSLEGRLLDANAWLVAMLGHVDQAELVGRSFSGLLADGDTAAWRPRPADTSGVRVEELRMRRVDGSELWTRLLAKTVRDESGRPLWHQVLARDDTDEHAAAARQARLVAAVEQTAESVVICDPDANILYVNPAFERATGYARDEVIGRNPRLLQSGTHASEFYRAMWAELVAGRTWHGELVNRRKDGSLLTEVASITPVLAADGRLSTYVAVKRDVTAERAAAERQRRVEGLLRERQDVARALAGLRPLDSPAATAASITSALAGVPGVLGAALVVFEGPGARLIALSGAASLPLEPGAALPLGRARVLQERSSRGPWSASIEDDDVTPAYGDWVAKTGVRAFAHAPIGDEHELLGVLVIGTGEPEYAHDLADHLPILSDFANAARLLLTDAWLVQRTRDAGRRRVARLIARHAFRTVFQPVIDLTTGLAVGFEALTRFDDGTPPDVAFATAREVGLGLELESATIATALAASVDLPAGAWLSLNVSPELVVEGDRLRGLLASRSRSIVLEVTEHDAVDDYARLRTAFVELGPDLRLAVDDTGAGVANLNHIVELRPDFVKIDIGLIRGINADLSRQALVVGLHHFARASNREVVAEGIETDAEFATLRALDLRFGQGYLLGRPAPASDWSAREGGSTPANLDVHRRARRRLSSAATAGSGTRA